MRSLLSLAAATAVLAMSAQVLAAEKGAMTHVPPKTDAEMIDNALAAAPKAVAETAGVVAIDDKGNARTLREAKGNFTCLPDNPMTPGNDPMCLDQNGMAWAQAWMSRQPPPAGKIGLGYMLQGGSDASNDDPFATEPGQGTKWVDTGPHVMILGDLGGMEGHPRDAANPRVPYVMFPGTPYAHMMVPVGEEAELTAQVPAASGR